MSSSVRNILLYHRGALANTPFQLWESATWSSKTVTKEFEKYQQELFSIVNLNFHYAILKMDSPAFFYEEIPASGWDIQAPETGKTVNWSQYIKYCMYWVSWWSHTSLAVWKVSNTWIRFSLRLSLIWGRSSSSLPICNYRQNLNHFWYKEK